MTGGKSSASSALRWISPNVVARSRNWPNADEQLSLLANNATDAVFRLSLDGHCLYASPSARDLLGIDPALLIGVQLLARFHPDDTETVLGTFAALSRGEREDCILAYRSELVHQPGTFRWMEAHCGLVRDEGGMPREIIASIRDVSKSKAMEEELRPGARAGRVRWRRQECVPGEHEPRDSHADEWRAWVHRTARAIRSQ